MPRGTAKYTGRIRPKVGQRVRFNCWTIGNTTYGGCIDNNPDVPPSAERTGVVVEASGRGSYWVLRDKDGVRQRVWSEDLVEYVQEGST